MKQRVYIDTSVVGGYFNEEFNEATNKLFERLKSTPETQKEILEIISKGK